MRLALLCTDNREHYREYDKTVPYFGTAPQALLRGLAECPEIEVHVVSCTRHLMTAPPKLAANVWFHSVLVPAWGWLRSGYWGCRRAVRRKLEELQPEVVHGQGTERECALSAALSDFPNLVTIHGNMRDIARILRARWGSYHWLAARLENYTLPRTGGVICNSRFTQTMVQERTPRTWLIPNAISPDFFAPPRPRARVGRPVLLNVGGIAANKQQLELLQAARGWRQRGLDFELRFLGRAQATDAYANRFLAEVQGDQPQGWVFYDGVKSPSELVERFDAAAALIHVSQAESFGMVAAEALARNLKYFGTAVGGLADVLEGVPCASVVPLGDWERLELEVGAWLRAGSPRPTEAASLMRERYHPLSVAQRHLQVYRELLSTRS